MKFAVLTALIGLTQATSDLEQTSSDLRVAPNVERSHEFLERKENLQIDPDAYKTLCELSQKYGFRCKPYSVTTADGYITGLYRISGLVSEPQDENVIKPAVLMTHGIGADMMQWVFQDHHHAPAFVLATKGYDVWLGNNRGNRFSQKHATLTI
jgi:lysosomal acid lipase/cholesteryl ester hydrolase